jgi:hypothetical protein
MSGQTDPSAGVSGSGATGAYPGGPGLLAGGGFPASSGVLEGKAFLDPVAFLRGMAFPGGAAVFSCRAFLETGVYADFCFSRKFPGLLASGAGRRPLWRGGAAAGASYLAPKPGRRCPATKANGPRPAGGMLG